MIIESNDMKYYEVRVAFFRAYDFNGVEMRIYLYDRKNKKSYQVTGFEVDEKEEGAYSCPIVILDRNTVSITVESLKNAGFVPADLSDKNGEIDALKRHLDDMRQIISKNLKVGLGK